MKALNKVKGNISGGQKALQKALRGGSARRGVREAPPGREQPGAAAAVLVSHGCHAPGALAVVTVQKVVQYVDRELRRYGHQAAEPDVSAVRPQAAPVDRQGTSGGQRSRQVTR